MKQVYHDYKEWEDYKAGMWSRNINHEVRLLDDAIRFTGDAEEYGAWMLKVAKEWPIASEHNLSDLGQNRKAWIGHAACFLAIGCPEYLTRKAWGMLSQKQQDDANAKADIAIMKWEIEHGEANTRSLF